MNINLLRPECIVISDSEGEDENYMQLNCAPKYADKVVTINQIVDCYTSPKPKKTKSFQYVKMEHRPTECGATVRNEDTCNKYGLRRHVKQSTSFQYSALNRKSGDGSDDNTIDYLIKIKPDVNKIKRDSKMNWDDDKENYIKSENNVVKKMRVEKMENVSNESDWSSDASDSTDEDREPNSDRSSFDLARRLENFEKVRTGTLELKDVCLSCGATDNIVCPHPLFEGGLCGTHREMFQEWYFKYDQDGSSSYCSVCCMGDKVLICGEPCCGKCYCSHCLDQMVAAGEFERLSEIITWKCFFCGDMERSLIRRRENWGRSLQELFASLDHSNTYEVPPIPCPIVPNARRPIRVLSLFDGIATGLLALKQLGLKVSKFVASEIDESAIRLVQQRHSEVIHVGDITKLSDSDVKRLGPFDLVMGGSPCNDLSGANPRRRGLLDAEGTGCLFFDFYRVLTAARPNPDCHCDSESQRPFFWLFENVLSMKLVERARISRFLNCDPIMADARSVSAAARPRLFWGNLPHMRQLNLSPSTGDLLTVQSCLEKNRTASVLKLNTITTKPGSLYQGVTRIPPVKHLGKDDVLWCTEIERIFGVPEHYTDVNNLGPKERLALLGRSWSVPVMRHMLAPLKEYFQS